MPLEELQNGRYRLLQLIGQGAMGKVYLAQDTRIDRQVAIKVIQIEMGPYPDDEETRNAVRLFHREAQTIARLNDPHILPLFDFDEVSPDGSTPTYMVMPYCPEGSLADWLRQRKDRGLLAPQDIVQLVQQAASALQYAHDRGIIHRDVKPANFLIHSNSDNPNCPDLLLADFGVAKLSAAATRSGQSVRGTPIYMSPEQWSGMPVPATDQYALAVMVYELLTGRAPFQGTGTQVMYQHLMVQPPPPALLNPQLPEAVNAVLLHALAKDPAGRFPTITDFARALRQALLPELSGSSYEVHQPYQPPPASAQPLPPGTSYTTLQMPETILPQAPVVDTLGANTRGISYTTLHAPDTLPERRNVPPPGGNREAREGKPRHFLSGRTFLIAGLALLIILAGAGFALVALNQHGTSTTNGHGTGGATNTATSNATGSTLTQVTNPYPPHLGTLVLSDPLSDNSRGYMWDIESIAGQASCGFANKVYLITQDSVLGGIASCNPEAFSPLSDFTLQVQTTITSGDAGGITFRGTSSSFYLFAIATDGSYHFDKVNENSFPEVVRQGTSRYLLKGLNKPNLLAVVAIGNTFKLYANNHLIDTVTDSSYTSGTIGLAAEESSNATDVTFSNVMVWKM